MDFLLKQISTADKDIISFEISFLSLPRMYLFLSKSTHFHFQILFFMHLYPQFQNMQRTNTKMRRFRLKKYTGGDREMEFQLKRIFNRNLGFSLSLLCILFLTKSTHFQISLHFRVPLSLHSFVIICRRQIACEKEWRERGPCAQRNEKENIHGNETKKKT